MGSIPGPETKILHAVWWGQGTAYRVLEMFYFLIWVLVTWVCWFMKLY